MAVDNKKLTFNPVSGTFDLVQDVSGLLPKDGSEPMEGDLDLDGNTVINLAAPINPDDAATKDYVDTEIAALPDPIVYQGTWNASTNTPTLSNADTGVTGYLYQVNVAGSVDFGAGSISFEIGDKVVNNGSIWEKWDMTDAVTTVNGQAGVVVLTTTDIAEGSNLYFTDGRAQTATISQVITDGITTKAPSEDAVFDALALKAPLASPALTGTPTAPTAAPSTNTTQIATTAFVVAEVASVSGANTSLSNLGTTSINSDLLPSANNARTTGSASLLWLRNYVSNIASAAGDQIKVATRSLSFDGTDVATWFNNGFQILSSKVLRFTDSTTNTTGFQSAASATSIDYTLPAAAPTVNGQLLTSTTAGVMSWTETAYYSGYLTATAAFATGSTTYADMAAASAPNLTNVVNAGFGTVAVASGNLPGIIVVLPRTTIYEITATLTFTNSSTSTPSFRITDGSGTVINAGTSASIAGGNSSAVTLTGLYSGTSGSTTFKIQGAANAGTVNINNGVAAGTPAISWTIKIIR